MRVLNYLRVFLKTNKQEVSFIKEVNLEMIRAAFRNKCDAYIVMTITFFITPTPPKLNSST
jgi:hypothetical protein